MATAKQPLQEQETLSLKPKGLYTYPNPLSEVPQGALSQALNVILSRPSVLEQRRGIGAFGTVLTGNTTQLYNYQNRIIINNGTSLLRDSDGAGTWVAYSGSYSPPTNALVIRSFQANKNIYFLTNAGQKKLDALTNAITFSGAPAGLDGAGTTTGSGWFTNTTPSGLSNFIRAHRCQQQSNSWCPVSTYSCRQQHGKCHECITDVHLTCGHDDGVGISDLSQPTFRRFKYRTER